jgi:hypothetical protein
MSNDPQEAKRRFDDVYRSLLVIGPILSFAFSNYSLSQNFSTFIYYVGFPALITAVLLWAFSNLMNRSWEYHVKFIGYVFIWFSCSSLFSIVYTKGENPLGFVWFLAGIAVTAIVAYITGQIFVKNNIISQRYSMLMVILPIVLGLISLRFT